MESYCDCECPGCDYGQHCFKTKGDKGCHIRTIHPKTERTPRPKPETKRQRLDRGLGHLAEIKENLAASRPEPNFTKPPKKQP